MYYWKYNVPVVISDIDGTITKYLPVVDVVDLIDLMWWDIFIL